MKEILSIHGVPRSGTTWLGQILNSSSNVRYKYQPFFSYAFKDVINSNSTKEQILKAYNDLYSYQDDFLDQVGQVRKGISPSFENKVETPEVLMTKMVRYHYLVPHLINELDNIKFIFIVRNPCATINSWINSPKEFYKNLNLFEEWRFAPNRNNFRPEEYFGFEKWKEATKLFLEMKKRYPERVFLIKYEDLVENPMEKSEELFKFANLEMNTQTEEFIKKSQSENHNDPYSVYKGKSNLKEWEGQLDQKIIHRIYEELQNTEFEQFL